jgi:uncharacterized protein with NRDE domain
MCTITYLPCQNGYILTQNRDESPLRTEAVFPVSEHRAGHNLIYPKDPEGSGSWFVSTEAGLTLCVMNGAYHANKKPGDYKHSRGLVPLHYLEYAHANAFLNEYHYRELEAFNLLVCGPDGVDEFVWDENEMVHHKHAPGQLIFQSAPLYNAEQQAFRKRLFHQFLAENNVDDVLDFHTKPQIQDPAIDILMDRGRVGSVSTIQRRFMAGENSVTYLEKGADERKRVSF